MKTLHVGFTGTQEGMTPQQIFAVHEILTEICDGHRAEADTLGEDCEVAAHHGDCVGADADFHTIARAVGCRTIGHPPSNPSRRAWCSFDELRPELPYLQRNRAIVSDVHVMIGTPKEPEEQLRSGTWSTLREAARTRSTRLRRTVVVLPDGTAKWWER